MAVLNDETKEVAFKLVFAGAALSGKTSNVIFVHQALEEHLRGDLISLSTSADRTLFFDYLAMDAVLIAGYQTKFLLYTVPGQVVYNATRELVLRGADGIVFVVDSSAQAQTENREAMDGLVNTLRANGTDLWSMPLVFQYNKRDLPDALPTQQLQQMYNPHGFPAFEGVATQGFGVMECLDTLSNELLRRFHAKREEHKERAVKKRAVATAATPW